MFVEHEFKTKLLGSPQVRITHEAMMDMWYLVQEVQTEVGWLCVIRPQENGDLLISEVVLPKQQCHAATTELNEEGLSLIYEELMKEDLERGVDPSGPSFRASHLNCWIHSHANMEVTPSTQDDQQMADFCLKYGDDYDWWLRGIVNKKKQARFTLYFKALGRWMVMDDVPWRYVPTTRPTPRQIQIKTMVEERVSYIGASTGYSPPTYPAGSPGTYYTRYGNPTRYGPTNGNGNGNGKVQQPAHETTILTAEDFDRLENDRWYSRKRSRRHGLGGK